MRIEVFGADMELDEALVEESEEEIQQQVEEFVKGGRTGFELSYDLPGTPRGEIWRAMAHIPHGETRSYSEIAEKADSAAIAVGQACASNPLPLILPCHRVIGKNSIGGYQAGEEVKRKLLELEGADF